jgi:hypothetical protein
MNGGTKAGLKVQTALRAEVLLAPPNRRKSRRVTDVEGVPTLREFWKGYMCRMQ